jgi:putative membrane protein (TIGR04086 family)
MENRFSLNPILTGIASIIVILLASSILLSAIIHFSSIKESAIQLFLAPITFITLFVGGCIAGIRSGSRGWYVGCTTGLAFLLILWLISFLGYDTIFSIKNLMIYGGYLVLSTVGGMVGVNLSSNKNN